MTWHIFYWNLFCFYFQSYPPAPQAVTETPTEISEAIRMLDERLVSRQCSTKYRQIIWKIFMHGMLPPVKCVVFLFRQVCVLTNYLYFHFTVVHRMRCSKFSYYLCICLGIHPWYLSWGWIIRAWIGILSSIFNLSLDKAFHYWSHRRISRQYSVRMKSRIISMFDSYFARLLLRILKTTSTKQWPFMTGLSLVSFTFV